MNYKPAIDFGLVMRVVMRHVRNRETDSLAIAVVTLLLNWKRRDQTGVEAPLEALRQALHVKKERVVAVLADLDRLKVLTKLRRWVYRAELGKRVQAANLYVFSVAPPEFPGGTAILTRIKKRAREATELVRAAVRDTRLAPHAPIRSVQEQLAMLLGT
jgi:hypothetical protein